MFLARIVEDVVKTDGRRVLAGLIRLTGDFDAADKYSVGLREHGIKTIFALGEDSFRKSNEDSFAFKIDGLLIACRSADLQRAIIGNGGHGSRRAVVVYVAAVGAAVKLD